MNTRVSLLNRFARSRNGNVAILFGLLGLPLLGFAGAAIDYGFAVRRQVKLQAATDAAALSLCQMPLAATRDELQRQAVSAMTGFMGSAVTVDTLGITSNPRQITLTTHTGSAALFSAFTSGKSQIEMGTTARCATPMQQTFEIALVLDNTGSMTSSSGGQSKMEALKSAAEKFVDSVAENEAFSKETRISLVPFAGSVAIPANRRGATWIDRAGKSRYHWDNVRDFSSGNNRDPKLFTSRLDIFAKLKTVRSNWDWAGCVETLPHPLNVQDVAPTPSNADSYFVPMFAPDEPGNGTNYYTSVEGYASYNSYLNDTTPASDCNSISGANYMNRLGRECKYIAPNGAASGASAALGGNIQIGPNFGCTTQPLMTLTEDTEAVKSSVRAMFPLGSTNIHEGLMWGWRTLSPLSVFAAESKPPASYQSETINKILILMTDGENMWPAGVSTPTRSYYTAAGYTVNADNTTPASRLPSGNQTVTNQTNGRAALDALTAQACRGTKSTGISVFTIGFSTPSDPIDRQGLNLLRDCATAPDQFFEANDSAQLIAAFENIAKSIGKLRLTQ